MNRESNSFCFHVWLILLGKRARPGTKYRDHKEAIPYAKEFHVMRAGLAQMTVGSGSIDIGIIQWPSTR